MSRRPSRPVPSREAALRRALLREKAAQYAALNLSDPAWSDEQILGFIAEHPILLQRPIVESPLGTKLCRPSEAVLELLPVGRVADFTKENGERVLDPGAWRPAGVAAGGAR